MTSACSCVANLSVNEAERRTRLHVEYRALYDEVLEILFRIDPVSVHQQDDTEKYVPEVVTILPRLRDATCIEDMQQIIHEELRRWYGSRVTPPSPGPLQQAATNIWFTWHCFVSR